jgi:hypothetical protein
LGRHVDHEDQFKGSEVEPVRPFAAGLFGAGAGIVGSRRQKAASGRDARRVVVDIGGVIRRETCQDAMHR